MRLIDADKLLEETRRDRDYARKNGFMDMYYERQTLIDRIEAQPTAYSVEKVVEELERIRAKETCNKEKCDTKEICRICVVDDAIEIVKQGGISDDVCECRRLKDCKSLFETSCGYIFAREGFKYCPYCGKKIKVVGDRYED